MKPKKITTTIESYTFEVTLRDILEALDPAGSWYLPGQTVCVSTPNNSRMLSGTPESKLIIKVENTVTGAQKAISKGIDELFKSG